MKTLKKLIRSEKNGGEQIKPGILLSAVEADGVFLLYGRGNDKKRRMLGEGETFRSGDGRSFVVRAAGPSDVESVVELWWQLMSEHEFRDPDYWGLLAEPEAKARYQEYLERNLNDPDHVMLVAEVEGKVAGFVHGRPLERPAIFRASGVARVDEVAVDRRFRGVGLGRSMMQSLFGVFQSRGYRTMELMVDAENPPAQALYKSLGFYPRQFHLLKKI